MIYDTEDLYGTYDLSFLGDMRSIDAMQKRIEMLEVTKHEESKKPWLKRNFHLIKKIEDSQAFWLERIREEWT